MSHCFKRFPAPTISILNMLEILIRYEDNRADRLPWAKLYPSPPYIDIVYKYTNTKAFEVTQIVLNQAYWKQLIHIKKIRRDKGWEFLVLTRILFILTRKDSASFWLGNIHGVRQNVIFLEGFIVRSAPSDLYQFARDYRGKDSLTGANMTKVREAFFCFLLLFISHFIC